MHPRLPVGAEDRVIDDPAEREDDDGRGKAARHQTADIDP
jgi:hypothetical protein